jgi:uncharacterized protein (TIGR03086 family)
MTASDIDLLASAFDKTERIMARVSPDQAQLPTPCGEFDVARLVDHLVGWAKSFEARLTGGTFEGDPNDYRAGADPAADFHDAAAAITGAYRDGGDSAEQLPVGVLLMECIVHGWDLATATGQPTDITPAEADRALEMGQQMLKPEYRGPGQPFGYEAQVSDSAGSVEKLVAFLGRSPDWPAASA